MSTISSIFFDRFDIVSFLLSDLVHCNILLFATKSLESGIWFGIVFGFYSTSVLRHKKVTMAKSPFSQKCTLQIKHKRSDGLSKGKLFNIDAR